MRGEYQFCCMAKYFTRHGHLIIPHPIPLPILGEGAFMLQKIVYPIESTATPSLLLRCIPNRGGISPLLR